MLTTTSDRGTRSSTRTSKQRRSFSAPISTSADSSGSGGFLEGGGKGALRFFCRFYPKFGLCHNGCIHCPADYRCKTCMCARANCLLLVSGSWIVGVVGRACLFAPGGESSDGGSGGSNNGSDSIEGVAVAVLCAAGI